MKKLLIVSPRFPPVNAPDMHRVRQSLPYFRDNGWEPIVFSVLPQFCEQSLDPLLCETVPDDIEHHQVRALPQRTTRPFGLGNLGIRAYWHLRNAVSSYLRRHPVDLIYFSTTAFVVMAMGPWLKRRFGIPFVIDLQDPWRNDYYREHPELTPPRKHWFDYGLNRWLEGKTVPGTDGVIAVSQKYIDDLESRYPTFHAPSRAVPFGFAMQDLEVAQRAPIPQIRWPGTEPEKPFTIVNTGAIIPGMAKAVKALFTAVQDGLTDKKTQYNRIRMLFVGSHYGSAGEEGSLIARLAQECGVADRVVEIPERISYFSALRLLKQADLLFVPGSDDVGYTASKIYPYVGSGTPILALFRSDSPVAEVIKDTRGGWLVDLDSRLAFGDLAGKVRKILNKMLFGEEVVPPTDWCIFEKHTARTRTGEQAELLTKVLDMRRSGRKSSAGPRAHSTT